MGEMQGRRLPDGFHVDDSQPGDFWRQPRGRGSLDGERGKDWDWVVRDPFGRMGTLAPDRHRVEEHSDGTITADPSVLAVNGATEEEVFEMGIPTFAGRDAYHGWLKQGVWTDA